MRSLIIAMLIALSGCSTTQMREEFMWLEPRDVTSAKDKYVRLISKPPAECFEKVSSILTSMSATVAQKAPKEYFLVVYKLDSVFKAAVDTTQVGIVVVPTESGKSRLEVASGNHYLAEAVSDLLFQRLEHPDKKLEEVIVRAKRVETVK